MQRCRQMSDIARNGVKFQSESTAGKEYHAFAFRLDEVDFCPCIAYVMARNKEAKRLGLKERGVSAAGLASDCKHLKEIRRVTCQWAQQSEADYRWDETCPNCGGPVVEEGTPMIPDGAGTDHVDDLRAMLADLKGGTVESSYGSDEPDEQTLADADDAAEVLQAAEDVIATATEVPPVDRQHGTIPAEPREWIEDLIASRDGVIPSGEDWKQLRELWGPIYGKRNIDRAYKEASTADAALARMMGQGARTMAALDGLGTVSADELIEELQDEYHGEPNHAALKAEFDAAFAALKDAGIEYDADDPIAARYRAASDAVNHSNRKRDFAIATGQLKDGEPLVEPDEDAEPSTTVEAEHVHFDGDACPLDGGIDTGTVTDDGTTVIESSNKYPVCDITDCSGYGTAHPPIDAAPVTRLELDNGIVITVTRSAGADGALLVMIDTSFEPDASDGSPGLRVLVNDEPVYAGKDYEPIDDDRDHAETLPGQPGYDTSYGDKIDQADAEAQGPEAAARRLAARIER